MYKGSILNFIHENQVFKQLLCFLLLDTMWKSTAGHKISTTASKDDDDWETDPDFVVRS